MTIYINGRSQPDVSGGGGGGGGEANTGNNVGAGAGLVFRDKLGVTLNFRSILAGLGVSVATIGDTVSISSTSAPLLMWGNDSVAATTTARYLSPFYEDSLAQTSPIQFRVPRAGTIRRLRVRHNGPAGNGNNIVYTLRVNGVATALSASLASNASDASDLVNQVGVPDGALIDFEVTKAASVGTSPSDIVVIVEFA